MPIPTNIAGFIIAARKRMFVPLLLAGLAVWFILSMQDIRDPKTYMGTQGEHWQILSDATSQRIGMPEVPVALPNRIDRSLTEPETIRYRVPLQVRHGESVPLGICVPRWSLTAEVWLDEVLLKSGTAGVKAVREYTRPQYIALPPQLPEGEHFLTVNVLAVPSLDPGLSEIWFGNADEIRRACLQYAETKHDRVFGASYLIAIMGLAGLAIWRLLNDRSALYFFLMALTWWLHFFHLSASIPMSLDLWSLLYFITRTAFVLPMFIFCLTFIKEKRTTLIRALFVFYVTAIALLPLLPAARRADWLSAMAIIYLMMALHFLWILVRFALRESGLAGQFLAGTFVFVIGAHAVDLARWTGYFPYGWPSHSYIAVPLLSLAFVTLLIERKIKNARREAEVSEQLRSQLEEQRKNIRKYYEQIQDQREKIAVLNERRRIVRDMHDGVGSQLVSASALLNASDSVTPQQAAMLIDRALLELRSVLDVMTTEPSDDPEDEPVAALLGALRWRLEPVLQARKIKLSWQLGSLPLAFLYNDVQRLQLMRLLQEAFSNTIKHANASRIHFSLTRKEQKIVLVFSDDGDGFSQPETQGIGLDSMRTRARAIDAALSIDGTSGKGTTIMLEWDWPAADMPGAK